MNFGWTSEQQELYDGSVSFARERLNHTLAERERAHQFGADEWRACAEFGLTGLCLPVTRGGMGLDCLTTTRVFEGFGRGCEDAGLLMAAAAHLFACAAPIAHFAGEPLQRRYLAGLAAGTTIGANAITEAGAGSDVFALTTRATRAGDDYLLSGTKSYVTNGPVADLFLVYAMTEPTHGYLGVSAFAIPRATPGLTLGPAIDKIGLHTAPTCSLYLDDCRVSSEHLVGDEGQGAAVFGHSMQWERTGLFASYLGAMERTLARCVSYAKERRQWGKPIAKQQAVAHRIADMKLRLESARLLLYQACWQFDQARDATLETALAKLAVSEAAIESALDAIRIHGGAGTVRDVGVERGLRDAVPSAIFSGTSEMQRNIIARALGL